MHRLNARDEPLPEKSRLLRSHGTMVIRLVALERCKERELRHEEHSKFVLQSTACPRLSDTATFIRLLPQSDVEQLLCGPFCSGLVISLVDAAQNE